MDTERERIEVEALKLSVEDRQRLAERLLTSLLGSGEAGQASSGFATPEIEKSWVEESHRRLELMKRGVMESYPAEEVLARLRASLKR